MTTSASPHADPVGAESPDATRPDPTRADASIMTVLGQVKAESLATILPSEHVLANLSHVDGTDPSTVDRIRAAAAFGDSLLHAPLTIDRLGDITLGAPNLENRSLADAELAASELSLFGAAGGSLVVDATPRDLGRSPRGLAGLAERTGVAIVMGSGRYRGEAGATDATALADEIVADLTHGTDGIRAGVIGRLGVLDPEDAADRAVLVASARASARTGAPVIVTHPGVDRIDAVLTTLLGAGASANRIAVTGCGTVAASHDSLLALARRGVFVLFDRLGRQTSVYTTWDDGDLVAALTALLPEHGHQVLLSPASPSASI
ncbi:phosphotriesterase [Humibacter ginsenosidimutans]|uniref:Phosphotriesterase n=1 Tax=Humibacter ginsenosidimutans TaxID=2599293 RepID=A0A5B8M1F6_9MICO|nr:phosphotriesterase [Humibacter ginsenosidimutans]QDZ14163.1 phosphotriesterase [Humibacter ginsenosidimutans]